MNYSLYLNGVFESVLDEIINAQKNNSGLTCYLQPYSSRAITKLRSDSPSLKSSITVYISTSSDLSTITYKGNIVGWEDKEELNADRLLFLNNHIEQYQPGEKEIYMYINETLCKNLISVNDLIKLDGPIPVDGMVKVINDTPLKAKTTAGGWSYVNVLSENDEKELAKRHTPFVFKQQKVYLRKDIINAYGGQIRSGITTPSKYPLIFLFTSPVGKEYGYIDGWTDDGSFEICGEGQVGDMKFIRGNKAVLNHRKNGEELHLFEAVGNGYVRYISEMVYKSHREDRGEDLNGDDRKLIIFELTPKDFLDDNDGELTSTQAVEGKKVLRYSTVYERDPKARSEALAIHGYTCMACDFNFEEKYGDLGKDFIHVHHIKPLNETGETKIDPRNDLIPLCPNCHAMVHKPKTHTLSLEELKQLLKQN